MDEALFGARPDRHDSASRSSWCGSRKKLTLVIVTHNLQQAARVADRTAFMWDGRPGRDRRHRADVF